MAQYFVYIMTNRSGTLYTGVTSNLERRLAAHRLGESDFTSRYRIGKLLYYETTNDPRSAIEREKQIKRWTRVKKLHLVKLRNPRLMDLARRL